MRASAPTLPLTSEPGKPYIIQRSQSGTQDGTEIVEANVRRGAASEVFSDSGAQRSAWWSTVASDVDEAGNEPWERPVDPMLDGSASVRVGPAAVSPRMPLHPHDPAYRARPPAAGLMPEPEEELGGVDGQPAPRMRVSRYNTTTAFHERHTPRDAEVTVSATDNLLASPKEREGPVAGARTYMNFGEDAVARSIVIPSAGGILMPTALKAPTVARSSVRMHTR